MNKVLLNETVFAKKDVLVGRSASTRGVPLRPRAPAAPVPWEPAITRQPTLTCGLGAELLARLGKLEPSLRKA